MKIKKMERKTTIRFYKGHKCVATFDKRTRALYTHDPKLTNSEKEEIHNELYDVKENRKMEIKKGLFF